MSLIFAGALVGSTALACFRQAMTHIATNDIMIKQEPNAMSTHPAISRPSSFLGGKEPNIVALL